MSKQVTTSENYEKALLGCIMYESNRSLYVCAKYGINENSFTNHEHQQIWLSIQKIAKNNKPVDLLTVPKQLAFDKINITASLDAMVDRVPTVANVEHYAKEVKEAEKCRKLLELTENVKKGIQNGETSSEILLKMSEISISLQDGLYVDINTLKDIRQGKVSQWRTAQSRGFVGVPFTLPTINQYLGGWRKGVMGIIAAYRGQGKSTLVRQQCVDLAERGFKVGLFTLEDPVDIAGACMAGYKAGISTFRLDTGVATDREIDRVNSAWQIMGDLPLWVVGNSSHIGSIISTARLMKMRYNLDIIFIDHIQFISPYRLKHSNRNDTLSQYSGQIVGLAKELDIPIICTSQLSRDSEKSNRKPKLSDLRDSGSLEQDSRQILMLFWDPERELFVLEVMKNNYGISNKEVYLRRIDGRQKFEEWAV